MSLHLEIPKEFREWLRIGTCSWKFDSWKGLIYEPEKAYRPDDYLADYAKHLNSVEVDQWFWSLFPGRVRLPEPQTVSFYAASVPEGFVFTVKAPNSITLTHFYSKQPAQYKAMAGQPNAHFLDVDLLEKFLDLLSPLGPKLGPIMFQFEYLNKTKMPAKEVFFEKFGAFINKAPAGYQYAVEIRNPNYLTETFFDFLKDHNLGFVYLDGYYMPPIGRVYDKYDPQTAPFQVIRLHGGDRLEIETETGGIWNRVVAPKPKGLESAAKIVRANVRRKTLTFVNLNNHYEGSSPLSIQRFLDVLAAEEDPEDHEEEPGP